MTGEMLIQCGRRAQQQLLFLNTIFDIRYTVNNNLNTKETIITSGPNIERVPEFSLGHSQPIYNV